MKLQSLVGAAFPIAFLASCGLEGQDPSSTILSIGQHINASNCEIFIDKVQTRSSSHGVHGTSFYIKTHNNALDGAIAEVGFHSQEASQSPRTSPPVLSPWTDKVLMPFLGAQDYFVAYVDQGSDYTIESAEGVFYVRTVKGTTYWLKSNVGGNFKVDSELYSKISLLYGPYYSTGSMMPTQDVHELRYLNPKSCR